MGKYTYSGTEVAIHDEEIYRGVLIARINGIPGRNGMRFENDVVVFDNQNRSSYNAESSIEDAKSTIDNWLDDLKQGYDLVRK